jgi:hypothetical protein
VEQPATTPPELFAAFQRLAKQLVAVPKRDLDRKIAAYKRRKIARKALRHPR